MGVTMLITALLACQTADGRDGIAYMETTQKGAKSSSLKSYSSVDAWPECADAAWRTIADQGACQSCWALSATFVIQSRWCVMTAMIARRRKGTREGRSAAVVMLPQLNAVQLMLCATTQSKWNDEETVGVGEIEALRAGRYPPGVYNGSSPPAKTSPRQHRDAAAFCFHPFDVARTWSYLSQHGIPWYENTVSVNPGDPVSLSLSKVAAAGGITPQRKGPDGSDLVGDVAFASYSSMVPACNHSQQEGRAGPSEDLEDARERGRASHPRVPSRGVASPVLRLQSCDSSTVYPLKLLRFGRHARRGELRAHCRLASRRTSPLNVTSRSLGGGGRLPDKWGLLRIDNVMMTGNGASRRHRRLEGLTWAGPTSTTSTEVNVETQVKEWIAAAGPVQAVIWQTKRLHHPAWYPPSAAAKSWFAAASASSVESNVLESHLSKRVAAGASSSRIGCHAIGADSAAIDDGLLPADVDGGLQAEYDYVVMRLRTIIATKLITCLNVYSCAAMGRRFPPRRSWSPTVSTSNHSLLAPVGRHGGVPSAPPILAPVEVPGQHRHRPRRDDDVDAVLLSRLGRPPLPARRRVDAIPQLQRESYHRGGVSAGREHPTTDPDDVVLGHHAIALSGWGQAQFTVTVTVTERLSRSLRPVKSHGSVDGRGLVQLTLRMGLRYWEAVNSWGSAWGVRRAGGGLFYVLQRGSLSIVAVDTSTQPLLLDGAYLPTPSLPVADIVVSDLQRSFDDCGVLEQVTAPGIAVHQTAMAPEKKQ